MKKAVSYQLSAISQKSAHDGDATGRAVVLSVIAPCYNEQANVEVLARRTMATFDAMGIEAELVLVDDGSKDETWACIERASAADRRVRGIRHAVNGGMEKAWRTGIEHARGTLACLIDADLQNRPEDVATLYRAYVESGCDVTQAVRQTVKEARQRAIFSRGLNFLLNVIFDTRARDSKSGFILCKREVMLDVLRHRYPYKYYQSFLGVAAAWRGYTIAEVDTRFECRHGGRSFIRHPVIMSIRVLWEVARFRWEIQWEPRRARQHQTVSTTAWASPGLLEDAT